MSDLFPEHQQALNDQINENRVVLPWMFNPCPCLKRKQKDVDNYKSQKMSEPYKTQGRKLIALAGINPYELEMVLFDLYSKSRSYCLYAILCNIWITSILWLSAILIPLALFANIREFQKIAGGCVVMVQVILSILWGYNKSRLSKQFINLLVGWSYQTKTGIKIMVKPYLSKGFTMKQFFSLNGNQNCGFKVIKSIEVLRIN